MADDGDKGGQGRVPPPVQIGAELTGIYCGGHLPRIKILEIWGQWVRVHDHKARRELWINWDCVSYFEARATA